MTTPQNLTTSALPQRKRPVHPPPVERHNAPVILFVTLAIQPRQPALANDAFHAAFTAACGDADAWSVGKYLIMPDHVHLFCSPARWPQVGIKRWSGYLKRRITMRLMEDTGTARREARPPGDESNGLAVSNGLVISAGGRASTRAELHAVLPWRWQADCWDTQIRNGRHYHEKWEYVRLNPVRAGLATRPEDWPWQGELNVLRW